MNSSYVYHGVYTGHSPTSIVIKKFTRSNRSHSSIFRPPINNVFHNVIEAWGKGVTEQHWSENHKPGTIIDVYRVPCTVAQMVKFYTIAESLKGLKYDFLGVLAFLVRTDIGRADKLFCSEFTATCFSGADITWLKNLHPERTPPWILDTLPNNEYCGQLRVKKRT